MDEQRQDDKLEPIHNSSVPIQDVTLKTSRGQWTIEMSGEREPGRSVLAVRHDDDDEIYLFLFTYLNILHSTSVNFVRNREYIELPAPPQRKTDIN